jgi:hypothetical protein
MITLVIVITLELIKSDLSEPKKAPDLLLLVWNYTSQKCSHFQE